MADPLSVGSGIAGLLSITGLMFSRTYKFAKAAKGAESSIQTLANEIRTLAGLLQSLSLVAIELETGPVDSAFQLHHVISCQQVLLKIERSTREADPADACDNKARSFMKKLKWPFTSAETIELIAEITRHQRLITVALSADSITHLQQLLSGQDDLRKGIKDIQDKLDIQREIATRILLDEKRKEVLQFFGSVDPTTNHETSKGLRHHQTGLWIIANDTFLAWTNNLNSRLWLSGIPGAGKTVLASVMIEEMMRQSTPEKAVAYFYCDYKDEQRQQLPNILGAIACQIARQDASQRSFALLQDYYTACNPPDKPKSAPKASILLGLIQDMRNSFDEVSIIVDALDECSNNRVEVVESLAGLNDGALGNIRTAFLSRDELEIRMILEDFMHIPIAAHSEDLKIFVFEEIEARIRKKKLRIKNPALKNEIMERLIHGADGIFRWVACQIDYLCTLPHDRARREALASLPPDLNSTYERILGRVASQPSSTQRIVRDTLFWTISAYSPLSIEELCEALSVEESTIILDADSRPDEEDILEHCSSLLRKAVRGNSLELAHFTVQEYLCSDALKGHRELAFFYAGPQRATEYMSRICLAYLNCRDFSRFPAQEYEERRAFIRKHPFHPYASRRWTTYASDHWNDQVIREQAQILFHPRKSLQFLNWAHGTGRQYCLDGEDDFPTVTSALTTNGINPLHLAAMYQLEWVVKWLLEEKVDANQSSMIGTPLHCALLGHGAVFGQVESLNFNIGRKTEQSTVLELLSVSKADPTLSYRDRKGEHYNALEIYLLSKRSPGELFGLFPGMSACLNSRCLHILEDRVSRGDFDSAQEVIDSVETKQLDPSLKSRIDRLAETLELSKKFPDLSPTTILQSKGETSMTIVQAVLLDRVDVLDDLLRASPECVGGTFLDKGKTTLHLAARHGSVGAASVLIARGANVEAEDDDGRTALHECAYSKSVEVLKLLHNQDANLAKVDNGGRTVWHLAAVENNVAALEVLLERDPKATDNLSKADARGFSPFLSAAEAGSRESTLELSRHMASFDERTEEGFEFVHFAILLAVSDFQNFVESGMDLYVKSNDGSSVLHYYAKTFPSKACRDNLQDMRGKICYLSHMGISVTEINENGQTPLHVLLSEVCWDPRTVFGSDLFCAIVKELGRSNTVNLKDHNGITALEFFCSHQVAEVSQTGGTEVLRTLITLGADVTAKLSSGMSPIQTLFERYQEMREKGFYSLVPSDQLCLMLDHTKDDDELTNTSLGARILYWAVEARETTLIEKLLAKSVGPCQRLPEKGYDSVLDCASLVCSCREVFRALLEKSNKDAPNKPHPRTGRNLLHNLCSTYSASDSKSDLMEMLIDHGLDMELKDHENHTPLLSAISSNSSNKIDVVRYLVHARADTSAQSKHGSTAAHLAVISGNPKILQMLGDVAVLNELCKKTIGAKFRNRMNAMRTISGCTCWHMAAYNPGGAADVLRYLFEQRLFTNVDCHTESGETTLQIMAYRGVVKGLKYLLSIGADPRSSNNAGETALHLAAESGEVEIIKILASADVDVDAATAAGMTPLHYAAKYGMEEAVDVLLKLNASYTPDNDNITPYGYALIGSHESTARFLQHHDFNSLGKRLSFEQNMNTALTVSIERGDFDLCKQIVEQGIRPKYLHSNCETCTHCCLAFARNDLDMVKYLVEHAFPVTGRLCGNWPETGFTPILLALKHNNKEMFELALEHTPRPQIFHQENLVFAAVCLQSHQCLETLLAYIQTHAGQSNARMDLNGTLELQPATEASPTGCPYESNLEALPSGSIVDGRLRTVDLLWFDKRRFNTGVGVSFEEAVESFTALHLAADQGDEMAAKVLLQYGAGVDILSRTYETPLHYAAARGSSEVVNILIQHGADVDARDNYLRTAAMRVAEVGDPETLQKLYEHGASLSLRDILGQDVLNHACFSSAELLAFILNKRNRPTLDHRGLSPLGIALGSRNPGVVSLALNSALAFDHANDLSRVPLYAIFQEQKPSLLRKLMRRASSSSFPFPTLEQARRFGSVSALHIAVFANKPEMLEILLQYGADIEYHEEYEGTPLYAACVSGRFPCVKLLVCRGAAISYDKDGTVWDGVGAAKRFPEIVAWLLCGRFTSQKALNGSADLSTREGTYGLWSGVGEVEVPIEGELKRRYGESLLEHCVRISEFRMSQLGTVWKGLT